MVTGATPAGPPGPATGRRRWKHRGGGPAATTTGTAAATATPAAAATPAADTTPTTQDFNWAAAGKAIEKAMIPMVLSIVALVGYLSWQSYLDTTPAGQHNIEINSQTITKLAAARNEREKNRAHEKEIELKQQQLDFDRERFEKRSTP